MVKKKLKVETYGLQDEVLKLRKEGLAYQKIAEELNKKYYTRFNHMDIKRFLDKYYMQLAEEVGQDEGIRSKAIKEFNMLNKQLDKLMKEMWEYFEKVKLNDEIDPKMISAANQILKLLEARHKFLGTITQSKRPTVQQKINIVQITESIDSIVEKLKQLGFVVAKPEDLDEKTKEKLKKKKLMI